MALADFPTLEIDAVGCTRGDPDVALLRLAVARNALDERLLDIDEVLQAGTTLAWEGDAGDTFRTGLRTLRASYVSAGEAVATVLGTVQSYADTVAAAFVEADALEVAAAAAEARRAAAGDDGVAAVAEEQARLDAGQPSMPAAMEDAGRRMTAAADEIELLRAAASAVAERVQEAVQGYQQQLQSFDVGEGRHTSLGGPNRVTSWVQPIAISSEVADDGPAHSAGYYRDQLLAEAGIDLDAWNEAVERGDFDGARPHILAGYEWYRQMATDHPELGWLVMANTVSPFFYRSMVLLEDGRQALAAASDTSDWANPFAKAWQWSPLDDLAEWAAPDTLDWLTTGNPLGGALDVKADDLANLNQLFLQMQQKIFLDMGIAHQAYLTGGAEEVRRLIDSGQIDDPKGYLAEGFDLQAQADVAEAGGDVGRANDLRDEAAAQLLRQEQGVVIVPEWDAVREDHGMESAAMSLLGNSPIPDGRSFHDTRPDGDPTRADQRVDWGLDEMTEDFHAIRSHGIWHAGSQELEDFDDWQARDVEERSGEVDVANGPL